MDAGNRITNLQEFIDKVDQLKKQDRMDLSSDEDLSIAIMNLISIEEHFFFTGAKTGKGEYFDLLKEAREMRKDLLKRIIKDYEGEVWCISKHLLAASMRVMEVGTKELKKGNKKDAWELFQKSYKLYSLFWAINLKVVDIGDVPLEDGNINFMGEKEVRVKATSSPLDKLTHIFKKAIDCCKE